MKRKREIFARFSARVSRRLHDEATDDSLEDISAMVRSIANSPACKFMTNLDDFPKFKENIWDDPSLCNNCYTRVQQVIPIWKEQYDASVRSALADTIRFKTEDGVVMYGIESREGEAGGIYRTQTSCSNCGSVGCRSIPDDVSRRKLLTQLSRIIDWLETQNFDPDEDEMRAIVHELKSETDRQGRDPEILAEAVEAGI